MRCDNRLDCPAALADQGRLGYSLKQAFLSSSLPLFASPFSPFSAVCVDDPESCRSHAVIGRPKVRKGPATRLLPPVLFIRIRSIRISRMGGGSCSYICGHGLALCSRASVRDSVRCLLEIRSSCQRPHCCFNFQYSKRVHILFVQVSTSREPFLSVCGALLYKCVESAVKNSVTPQK